MPAIARLPRLDLASLLLQLQVGCLLSLLELQLLLARQLQVVITQLLLLSLNLAGEGRIGGFRGGEDRRV